MAGGRDQLGPLERATRIVVALVAAEPKGIPTPRLLEIAAFGGESTHHLRQLTRLIDDLNRAGWDIRNTAPRGHPAVYRAFARDNRLRVRLTPDEQIELARAAMIAGDNIFADRLGLDVTHLPQIPPLRIPPPAVQGTDAALSKVLYAVERQCLLRFVYQQRDRTVHPHFVYPGQSGWQLAGHEDGGGAEKQFVTDRMSQVIVDLPGTAHPQSDPARDELDPLTWNVDSPTDVTVETDPTYRDHVETLLGTPVYYEIGDTTVRLTITVTHRAAFRGRVYELGPRVRIVSPDDVRDELLAELTELAGSS